MKRERFFIKSMLVVVIAALFLPMSAISGNLEPSAAPAPTMHTLEELYKKIDVIYRKLGARFEISFTDTVIDHDTGLLWQRDTDSTTKNWDVAAAYCNNLNLIFLGNWRLPTKNELAGLVDRTQSAPALPIGNPFTNTQNFAYWTSTSDINSPNDAYSVDFMSGNEENIPKSVEIFVRCVRSGP